MFVTDKGFVYVVLMRKKKDVVLAVKQLAKEIGTSDAIVCDGAGEQTSLNFKRFLNSIGTTLRVLEEGTQLVKSSRTVYWINESGCLQGYAEFQLPLRLLGLLYATSCSDQQLDGQE